jgi:putative DNA primase/helicase
MHEDYVELAWEMLGYLLFSGNPLQVAFLFYGSGGNGKGTLMRVIEDLLGRDNIASESLDDLNKNRFSAVNLYGRIANLAGDIDGTYQESTANFKKLTGEDTYAGEKKFGDRFNFESWAVPVFSANKIPGSADVTEGYLRRWVVLHFHKRIQNMIPGFSDQLSTELPGIAAKAVRALRVLMERERFDPRGEATKGKEEMALQIDQVRQWIASGEPMMAPDHWQSAIDLYAAYRIWAERSGQGKLREAEFSHRLEAIGYERQRFGGAVGHIGLHANLNPTQQHSAPETFFNG